MQDLPENHFGVSGASWVNIINNIIKGVWPCPFSPAMHIQQTVPLLIIPAPIELYLLLHQNHVPAIPMLVKVSTEGIEELLRTL